MVKKYTENENISDKDIFRSAMKDVKPLCVRKQRIERSPTAIPPRVRKSVPPQDDIEESFAFSDYEKLPPVNSEDLLTFRKDGISEKTLRKLQRGQYNPDAVLDLHGTTAEEARLVLDQFLTVCQQQQKRCIKIIHGRGTGTPVLKNRLNHWLREAPPVLAFVSINKGALYVLLRRTRA